MAKITLKKVVKRYGKVEAVKGIDLAVASGEFVVLVGPSGCGKSTTLRMIAGLEDVTEGEVSIGGRIVNRVEPKDRDIAMVFQNYAIYPHMTVAKNIGFGLRSRAMSVVEKERRVADIAGKLGLTDLMHRRPSELSGGQRQRVAIGRAMVRDPAVFLFDEPLSNLDAQLRAQMRLEIKKLHQTLGRTIVFVTHDQVEAMTLADRIVIMRDGEILQTGTPDEIYRRPVDMFVARFIGSPSMNMLAARSVAGRIEIDGFASLASSGPVPDEITVGVRPDDLRVLADGAVAPIRAEAVVKVVEPLGHDALVYGQIGPHEVVAKCADRVLPRPGDRVRLGADPANLHLFETTGGRTIRHGLPA
ncbi:MAG: sn-glycerol-3-phosphate ABC transporter ATP-binding protein UgpC [Rhodospirillales bacterium]|nr:sn-glycerol-3-phosphate ABC transporter ATP-binding protein UgpC [Rhodospirillales bacterium]